ncbi:MAG: hypothetical protein FWD57_12345 [Polyangiaceae bacterium]|nr:hypothetical protein [Polyangiaceae bacterium]
MGQRLVVVRGSSSGWYVGKWWPRIFTQLVMPIAKHEVTDELPWVVVDMDGLHRSADFRPGLLLLERAMLRASVRLRVRSSVSQ